MKNNSIRYLGFMLIALLLLSITSTHPIAADQSNQRQPRLFGIIHPDQTLDAPTLDWLDVLVPTGWYLQADGTIDGTLADGIDPNNWGYRVVPLVSNITPDGDVAPLADADMVALADIVREAGFDGALLGFDFPADASDAYTALLERAAAAFDEAGLSLGIVVEANRLEDYDLAALGGFADPVFLQSKAALSPSTEHLDALLEAVVPDKVGVLVAAASLDANDTTVIPIGFEQALAPFSSPAYGSEDDVLTNTTFVVQVEDAPADFGFDADAHAFSYTYPGPDGGTHRVWVAEASSFSAALTHATEQGLAAVLVDGLFHPDPAPYLTDVLQAYREGGDIPFATLPVFAWFITNADGEVTFEQPYDGVLDGSISVPGAYTTNLGFVYHDDDGSALRVAVGTLDMMVAEAVAEAPTSTDTPPANTPTDTVIPPTSDYRPEYKPSLTPTPTPTEAAAVNARVAGVEDLNLRAGPGTEYPVMGFLPVGEWVPVRGRTLAADANERPWLILEVDGLLLWGASWLLDVDADINSLGVVNAPTFEELTLTPPGASVAAGPTATLIPTEDPNATADPNVTAGPSRTPIPVSGDMVVAVPDTGGNRLNIRSGPSIYYEVVDRLAGDAVVEVLGRTEKGPWYKIDYQDFEEAWIAGWLTKTQGDIASVPIIASDAVPDLPADAPAPPPEAPVFSGGVASGGFELGGQVNGFGAAGHMHRAGMTWAKIQVRYNLGDGPGNAAGPINEAHANGFKVLLGIVGDPNQMASVGIDAYIGQFAAYLGGVASLGPDAIEVWNEMNIDLEWPTGQIDPAAYTRMLAAAYNAIKGANPNVMVISGALAPTGAEGAFGVDVVWNDNRYIQGMAAAGAANYMDCIGVHYNEGIVPPSWSSGDPRDGYYTRYLTGMISVYNGAFGGARPICFTELGYLTPEGYGDLSAGFAWAQQVTVAQQAAWLGEAAVIASNSGVRLMIVWNVNFMNFGADPMAGYAIVRPGDACPACITLGAAMGQ